MAQLTTLGRKITAAGASATRHGLEITKVPTSCRRTAGFGFKLQGCEARVLTWQGGSQRAFVLPAAAMAAHTALPDSGTGPRAEAIYLESSGV